MKQFSQRLSVNTDMGDDISIEIDTAMERTAELKIFKRNNKIPFTYHLSKPELEMICTFFRNIQISISLDELNKEIK